MADIWESSEMEGEGQGMVHGLREESADQDLITWVSAHSEEARTILCNSRDLKSEPFCGEKHPRKYGDSFLWRGAAP